VVFVNWRVAVRRKGLPLSAGPPCKARMRLVNRFLKRIRLWASSAITITHCSSCRKAVPLPQAMNCFSVSMLSVHPVRRPGLCFRVVPYARVGRDGSRNYVVDRVVASVRATGPRQTYVLPIPAASAIMQHRARPICAGNARPSCGKSQGQRHRKWARAEGTGAGSVPRSAMAYGWDGTESGGCVIRLTGYALFFEGLRSARRASVRMR